LLLRVQLTGDAEDVLERARHSSPSLCRLLPFVDAVSLHLSAWLVAVTAAETAFRRARPGAEEATAPRVPAGPPGRFDGRGRAPRRRPPRGSRLVPRDGSTARGRSCCSSWCSSSVSTRTASGRIHQSLSHLVFSHNIIYGSKSII